jgi:hypothetical protein
VRQGHKPPIVRYAPKETELLRRREMTRRANRTFLEWPEPWDCVATRIKVAPLLCDFLMLFLQASRLRRGGLSLTRVRGQGRSCRVSPAPATMALAPLTDWIASSPEAFGAYTATNQSECASVSSRLPLTIGRTPVSYRGDASAMGGDASAGERGTP